MAEHEDNGNGDVGLYPDYVDPEEVVASKVDVLITVSRDHTLLLKEIKATQKDHGETLRAHSGALGELLALTRSAEARAVKAEQKARKAAAEAARASQPDEAELADRAVMRDVVKAQLGIVVKEKDDAIAARTQRRMWVEKVARRYSPIAYSLIGGITIYLLTLIKACGKS